MRTQTGLTVLFDAKRAHNVFCFVTLNLLNSIPAIVFYYYLRRYLYRFRVEQLNTWQSSGLKLKASSSMFCYFLSASEFITVVIKVMVKTVANYWVSIKQLWQVTGTHQTPCSHDVDLLCQRHKAASLACIWHYLNVRSRIRAGTSAACWVSEEGHLSERAEDPDWCRTRWEVPAVPLAATVCITVTEPSAVMQDCSTATAITNLPCLWNDLQGRMKPMQHFPKWTLVEIRDTLRFNAAPSPCEMTPYSSSAHLVFIKNLYRLSASMVDSHT